MRPPDPHGLRAVCVPLRPGEGAGIDPVAAAGDDGHLFAGPFRTMTGRGTAARLGLPDGLDDAAALRAVRDWLAAVPVVEPDGEVAVPSAPTPTPTPTPTPAPTPVAMGALPFDRTAPASLAVPARLWCRTADGRGWLMGVEPADGRHPGAVAADLRAWLSALSATAAGRRRAEPTCSVEHVTFHPHGAGYAAAVAAAVRAIADGRLVKVVLARAVDIRFAEPPAGDGRPTPAAVLDRLWAGDPAFTAFSIPVPGGTFVGASPELIVARQGTTVTSQPLAGTVALPPESSGGTAADDRERAADTAVAWLLASTKDLAEHRLVVDDVAAGLAAHCADVVVPDHPTAVRLRSDARLGTRVRARVPVGPSGSGDPADRRCDALLLLAALHPTPAVGGVERRAALAHIAGAEAVPRGYWAGPVGWVDGTGDGEWVLAIRSALLEGRRARVHAGAGIVAGSDPELELAETSTKLAPVLDALVPGGAAVLAETVSAGPVTPSPSSRPRDPVPPPAR